jgi:hypothetical protein
MNAITDALLGGEFECSFGSRHRGELKMSFLCKKLCCSCDLAALTSLRARVASGTIVATVARWINNGGDSGRARAGWCARGVEFSSSV